MQTPVISLLDQNQISYTLLRHSQPVFTVEEAAAQRGVVPEQMVKSILVRDMGGLYALACVPGLKQVDPKRVRAQFNCRRMTCADSEDVLKVTGFQIGAVAPIALATPLPVIFDRQLLAHATVNISSGDRMAGIELALDDLMALCHPQLADICRE